MSQPRILEKLANITTTRPALTLCVTVTVYLLFSLLALSIKIDVDFSSMVPQEDPSVAHVFDTIEYFGSVDRAFVALENTRSGTEGLAPDSPELQAETEITRRCIDHLAETAAAWTWTDPANDQLEQMVPLIQGHHDAEHKRIQMDLLLSRSYLFLDDDYLDNLIKRLDPRYIQSRLKRGPSASVPAELRDRDLLGVWGDYLSFWSHQNTSSSNVSQKGSYICSNDERFHILIFSPRHPVKYMQFCMAMNEKLMSLNQELAANPQWSHLKLHMVGGYISAARDYSVVRSSLFKTMISSTIGVVLLFGIAYRSLRLIILIGIGLVPAISASLGVTTLLIGSELSIIVSAFAAILIGLGVDFIIHLYNSYCWSIIEHPGDRAAAAKRALVRVGPSIIVGCLTSVGTFAVLGTSEFRGIFELGIVTGCGLLMILISLIIVVPAFLTLWGPKKGRQPRGLFGYGKLITRFPLPFGVVTIAMIIASFVILGSSQKIFILDDNMRNLRPYDKNYEDTLALADDLGIRFGSNKVTLFGDNEEKTLNAALKFVDSLHLLEKDIPIAITAPFTAKELNTPNNKMHIGNLPRNKHDLLARYIIGTPWGDCHFERMEDNVLYNIKPIRPVADSAETLQPGDPISIRSVFGPMQLNSAAKISPIQQRHNLKRLREEVKWDEVQAIIDNSTEAQQKDYGPFLSDLKQMRQRALEDELLLPSQLASSKLRSIINTFYHRHQSEHHFLITLNVLYDRTLIPLEELQAALGVSPSPNGKPVQKDGITAATCGIPTISHYLQKTIVGDFTKLTSIAMILVTAILFLGVRQPVYVLLSMLTLGIGLLFTLAVMRLFNTPWNIINIAVVPLIIGIGIDNSVHFLHCLRHHSFDREGIRKTIAETGHPIMMTALTSIIGFGSLLFNAYRGIQSIGIIASIGIFACMIAALFGLPLLIIAINEISGKNDSSEG